MGSLALDRVLLLGRQCRLVSLVVLVGVGWCEPVTLSLKMATTMVGSLAANGSSPSWTVRTPLAAVDGSRLGSYQFTQNGDVVCFNLLSDRDGLVASVGLAPSQSGDGDLISRFS